jgi:multiple sugar transport system permease protein
MRSPMRKVLDVAAVVVVAAYLLPLMWIVLTAIKPTADINSPVPVWSFTPTFEHFLEGFRRFGFAHALIDSAVVVVTSTIITMVLALMCAYALARLKVRGADFISLTILSLRFMPGVVVAVPYYLMFQSFNLIDTRIGLIIVYVAFGLPFAVWLLRSFLLDIPREVEEAARLDGLGWMQILFRIVAPMATSGIAVTAIFTFVFAWNEFLFAFYLSVNEVVTLPIQIFKMVDLYNVLWGPISAAVVMQLVPMLIVVFLLQKHIVRGLTMGAVK